VATFVADLRTFRDRAITLVMLLGGLPAAEVQSLRLADVDMGLRRVRSPTSTIVTAAFPGGYDYAEWEDVYRRRVPCPTWWW
jgi:integrase